MATIESVLSGRHSWVIEHGNSLELLRSMPDNSIHCFVTSPPYWALRSYGTNPQVWGGEPNCDHSFGVENVRSRVGWESTPEGQKQFKAADSSSYRTSSQTCQKCGAWKGELGSEPVPDCLGWARGEVCSQCYICHMRVIFAEVRRVMRPDGTAWVNLGDSYSATGKGGRDFNAEPSKGKKIPRGSGRWGNGNNEVHGLPAKNLIGVPWRFALAMQADGFYLRQEIIWQKPSAMPESVKDRCTRSHEQIFLLAKSERYYFDSIAIREPAKASSIARLAQNIDQQNGSDRISGKTNGNMKAVRFGGDKADGYGTRIHSGKEWNPMMAGGAIGIEDRKTTDATGEPYLTANKRTVWSVANSGTSEAHFAVYPPALVEPMILAGTSEHGCCAECGKPYERLSETTYSNIGQTTDGRPAKGNNAKNDNGGECFKMEERTRRFDKTLGWQRTCKCANSKIVVAVVCDPFNGSGTTGLVALRLNLRYIGLELKEEYIKIATKRIIEDAPLFNGTLD